MKNKEIFTEAEIEFLKNTIERKTVIIEKEKIDLNDIGLFQIENQVFNDKNYLFLAGQKRDSNHISEKKEKLIQAINNCDDFNIETYGGYDDYDNCSESTLITYDLVPESDELFMERIKFFGRAILQREKAKLSRLRKLETRKVLFEKTIIKKKRGRPKTYPPLRDFPEIRWHT